MEIKNLLEKYKKVDGPPKRQTPHELAYMVDEIKKVVGFRDDDEDYGYKFWLVQVKRWAKRTGKAYPELFGILKNIERMNPKYPKGKTLTNLLKK